MQIKECYDVYSCVQEDAVTSHCSLSLVAVCLALTSWKPSRRYKRFQWPPMHIHQCKPLSTLIDNITFMIKAFKYTSGN